MLFHKIHNWRYYFPTLQQSGYHPVEGVVDDSIWRKGSFEIVSSDAVRFRVDCCHLKCSTAIDSNLGTAILTDTTIETAETIRSFLALATNAPLPLRPSCAGIPELLAFVAKWGAPSLRQPLWAALESAVRRRTVWAPWAFQAAAFGDNAGLCSLVLRTEAHNVWAEGVGTGTPGESVWDPAHWPPAFRATPTPYLCALERAWESAARKGGLESIADVEQIAGEFERFLRIARSASMALHVHDHTEKVSRV
ncbi:hypothetical protein CC85DRAFT_304086 [Cutaneotrichosporon oleaginosum]|uniref:Uncharacterized protein n=1 Tax=Cutaneotrichosporon oleaginosum TaxID=879819 RepID=A0A0J0XHI4_9TREE|nr:uncharacterized protein CC85DRAFT_304086 [Cutaneotrichosporon oleaginosum]KLT40561.1 hypothetical protein CC85DRAFT_304086 [Cutaneotrichosporon oleaginosum]TXT08368.1 hypothetical protein COLE_05292 [Cutaneotrichosporon oleaginosum]